MEELVTATTETKNIVNPRVEIDTSPPFESVKEAVDRFGGRGPWIPHHLLRLAAHPHNGNTDDEEFNVEKMEELERDLIIKEQQTLSVLKEVESAKRLVEGLKFNLIPEFMASPDPNLEIPMIKNDCNDLFPALSPGLMFMELNRAKSNLNKTSIDLAVIQESVESLNKKMRKDKVLVERRMKMQIPNSGGVLFSRNPKVEEAKGRSENCTNTSMDLKQVDFETEQFKKMTEASRYEVMKAMTEIERTKNSIRMAEMRLNAAKKMEEAAKAVEAIALAERNSDQNSSHDVFLPKMSNGITLSFEEYRSLTQKAQQVEEMCKTKFIDSNTIQMKNEDHQSEVTIMEKFEEIKQENQQSREDRHSKFKFRNSHSGHRSTRAVPENATTSIGDILGRKVILQDDIFVGKHVENYSEREHISLSQMLREQSRHILHPTKSTEDGNVEKSYFVQRKKFGFIQVPLSIKKTKKKAQPLNMR